MAISNESPVAHFELLRCGDVRLLEEALAAFHEVGIRIWLDQGTLLGLVRESGLLIQDRDLDFGVWRTDWDAYRPAVLGALRDREFRVLEEGHKVMIVRPREVGSRSIQIALYRPQGSQAHKYFRRRRADLRARLARLVLGGLTGGFVVELLSQSSRVLKSSARPRLTELGGRLAALNRSFSSRRRSILIRLRLTRSFDRATMRFLPVTAPIDHFVELRPATVNGIQTWLPRRTEDYLAFKYGKDWRVPRVDWDAFVDDGGVRWPTTHEGASAPSRPRPDGP